jgi:hypothetical protein
MAHFLVDLGKLLRYKNHQNLVSKYKVQKRLKTSGLIKIYWQLLRKQVFRSQLVKNRNFKVQHT